MSERSEARWLLVLLAAQGTEAAGALLQQFWKSTSRRGRLDSELRRLEQAGHLGHTGAGTIDARLFRLTPSGQSAVQGPVDPEALWSRPWDGRWRMVLFDIPQSRAGLRTQLRRKLKEQRCGWLQNSVWLSPDPLDALKELFRGERASTESLVPFEGRPAGGETDEELVASAWDFDRIGKVHASYAKVLQLRPGVSRRSTPEDWIEWLRTEERSWQAVLKNDPFLPSVLLPSEYAGRSLWAHRLKALHAAGQALGRGADRS